MSDPSLPRILGKLELRRAPAPDADGEMCAGGACVVQAAGEGAV